MRLFDAISELHTKIDCVQFYEIGRGKMRVFENPANKYREKVSGWSRLWVLIFGLFYLAVKGLWGHVVINIAAMVLILVSLPPAIPLIWLIVYICYAFVIPNLIARRYLRMGWIEVTGLDKPSTSKLDVGEPHF